MKLLTLFIAGAMAATPVVKRDISAITSDLAAIQTATNNLDSAAVKAFSGASDASAVLSAVNAVNSAITKGTSDAKSSNTLSATDAASLVSPVNDLAGAVSTAVDDTIAKKSTFVSAGLGGEVESQLQDIRSNAQSFSTALIAIVPESLKSTAQGLADPTNQSLEKGVSPTGSSSSSAGSAPASTSGAASTGATSPVSPSSSSNSTSSPSVVPYTGSANGMVAGLGSVAVVALAVIVL